MPHLIDGRDLLPPEPLELTLTALDSLSMDDELVVLLHRRPVPLLGILRDNGYTWQEDVLADGTHQVRIRRT